MATPLDLDDIFRRYSRMVATLGMRVLGPTPEVEDLVQDVFLEARRGLHRLINPYAVHKWLRTVTLRLARSRLRARRLRAFLHLGEGPDYEAAADPGMSPADRAGVAAIYRMLDALPVKTRLAWVLRHVEGEKLQDVADMCGISLATAKRRIAEAQHVIQKAVSR